MKNYWQMRMLQHHDGIPQDVTAWAMVEVIEDEQALPEGYTAHELYERICKSLENHYGTKKIPNDDAWEMVKKARTI